MPEFGSHASASVAKLEDGAYRMLGTDGERVETSTFRDAVHEALGQVSNGGKIHVPVSEYSLAGTINIDQNNVVFEGETRGTGATGNFEGEGHGGTKIEAVSDDATIAIGARTDEKFYGEFRDLYFYGTGPGSDSPAILVDDCDQSHFERLFVQNNAVGMRFQGRSNAYNLVQCVFIENADWHLVHRSSNKPQFYGSKFLNNAGDGVLIDGIEKAEFDQCDFHANAGTSIVFEETRRSVVNQCQFDQRTDQNIGNCGVSIGPDSSHITISDSQFQDWTKDGAIGVALGGDHNKVVACTFHDVETAIEISGVENVVSDCTFTDCETAIEDDGTRTLIDGRGRNMGDPRTTGQWHGNVAYASIHNADIYDTQGDDWYKATPTGEWRRLS